MDQYVELATKTIKTYILEQKIYEPEASELTDEMTQRQAGTFVSIHKSGELRGCIGTIGPTTENIGQEIIANAIAASTRDPRFPAITAEELPCLDIKVDVLGTPGRIASKEELDVKRYGVIVEKGYRRGLLLPDLEGVDSVEDQIQIAKMKAGISVYDDEVELYRFEVIRHE